MKIIVLGAPGAGKGTQARNIAQHYNIQHISTSDVLRAFLQQPNNHLADEIKDIMASGGLVSDDIVIDLVRKRIAEPDCSKGYIFDGFPRNLVQAEALTEFDSNMDAVVYVHVPDDIIVERVSGRVVCPQCGKMYHTHYFPPAVKNLCDACGVPTIQREDDKTRTVVKRLALYHQMTSPIIEFYKAQNLVLEFEGTGSVEEITKNIIKGIEESSGLNTVGGK